MPSQFIDEDGDAERNAWLNKIGIDVESFDQPPPDDRPPPDPEPAPVDPQTQALRDIVAENRAQNERFIETLSRAAQPPPQPYQPPSVKFDDVALPEDIRESGDVQAALRYGLNTAAERMLPIVDQRAQAAAQFAAAQAAQAIQGQIQAAQLAPTWSGLKEGVKQGMVAEMGKDPSFVALPFDEKLRRMEAETKAMFGQPVPAPRNGSSVRSSVGHGGARETVDRSQSQPYDESSDMMRLARKYGRQPAR